MSRLEMKNDKLTNFFALKKKYTNGTLFKKLFIKSDDAIDYFFYYKVFLSLFFKFFSHIRFISCFDLYFAASFTF